MAFPFKAHDRACASMRRGGHFITRSLMERPDGGVVHILYIIEVNMILAFSKTGCEFL